MEDKRTEQLEALETMAEFNQRIMKNIPILVKELNGAREEDTDKFLEGITQAINWEVQVLNSTMDVLNDGVMRVDKEQVNTRILALSDAIASKDDAKMAEAFAAMLPELETIGKAVQEVLA